jgi:hypothetical protein
MVLESDRLPKLHPHTPLLHVSCKGSAAPKDEEKTWIFDAFLAQHQARVPDSDAAHPTPKRALRSSGVPTAARRPSTMMAMRSHSVSASSMEWVVSTIARPWQCRFIRSHVNLRHRKPTP